MLKQFKALLNAYKEVERLRKENKELNKQVEDLSFEVTDLKLDLVLHEDAEPPKPKIKDLLQLVFEGKLEWYKYEDLKPTLRQQYYDQAQHILRMDIFNNEMNFLKSNWSKQAIVEAHAVEDVEAHTLKLSWMLLGIELFKLRLQEVPNLEQPEPTTDNLDAPI